MQIHLLLFFVPTSLQADGRFLWVQLSLFPAGRVLQEILVQAGQMLPASGKPAPAAEVLSLQCKIVDTLQPTPNIPKYLLDLSQAFLNFYNAISSISIPFMPKAAVFYFQLKIFSMLSCCKCEPQISNMINSSNQVGKPTLLYFHSLHPTQAGLAEAHHRLRTFKTSVSSEVQGVTNTEVPWLLLCLGWIHGYRL